MQYPRWSDGELTPLKAKNIDTGMGRERMVLVLQRVDNCAKVCGGGERCRPNLAHAGCQDPSLIQEALYNFVNKATCLQLTLTKDDDFMDSSRRVLEGC